jgi:Ca2+/Na+ antiporter
MQKSIEERLTDIENGITRLTKMEGCVFGALLILHKTSALFITSEQSLTEAKVSLEFYHRHGDRFLALMFGAIAVLSLAYSAMALYFTTLNSLFMVMFILCFILFLVLLSFGGKEYHHANSQFRVAEQKLTQAKEVIDTVREEVVASDKELAQIVAEWKELTPVPDDVVSKPKLED